MLPPLVRPSTHRLLRLIRICSFWAGVRSPRWRLQPTWQSLRLSIAQVPPFESGSRCSIVAARPTLGRPPKRIGRSQRQQLSPWSARSSASGSRGGHATGGPIPCPWLLVPKKKFPPGKPRLGVA